MRTSMGDGPCRRGSGQGSNPPAPVPPCFTISAFSVTVPDEQLLEGEHLVLSGFLSVGTQRIPVQPMVDCGATRFPFVGLEFARLHGLDLQPLTVPRKLEVVDGRPTESGKITHLAHHRLEINGHQEELSMFVAQLGSYPTILGIPWLRLHDVPTRFSGNSLTFESPYCYARCGITSPVTAHSARETHIAQEPRPFPATSTASLSKRQQRIARRKAEVAVANAQFRVATVDAGVRASRNPSPASQTTHSPSPLKIAAIGATPFCRFARREILQVFGLSL